MVKKVFCVLLVGIVLSSGLGLAARVEQSAPESSRDASTRTSEAIWSDEAYGVRGEEVQRFDSGRKTWASKGKAALEVDTLAWFRGEGATPWLDHFSGLPWDSLDTTDPIYRPQSIWFHVDTALVISGDSAWWCGNPDLGDSVSPPVDIIGGYQDLWYQGLTSPAIVLGADADSVFLIYEGWLRCEYKTDFPYTYSWDGYNVRVSTDGGSVFNEIYPYRVDLDTSRYRHQPPPDGRTFGEWNKLRCWEAHYDSPPCNREVMMGGFSWDKDTTWSVEIFDLRQFAGQTIQIQFAFASDWAMNTIDDGYGNIDSSALDWHGLMVDDILVVEGMDSLTLSPLVGAQSYDPASLGGTQLFLETCETGTNLMTAGYLVGAAQGSKWHIGAPGHGGINSARDGDPFEGEYYPCMEDRFVSPKIARADIAARELIDLWFYYYMKGTVDDPDELEDGSDFVYTCFQLDGGDWYNITMLHGTINWVMNIYDESQWWEPIHWQHYEDQVDLTPLLTVLQDSFFTIGQDTVTSWDTLRVGMTFESDIDTIFGQMLKVDDLTVSGRKGTDYDVGVSGLKIPGPNANDVELIIDTVAVTNYGFKTANNYFVYLEIRDSLGVPAFGPSQVALPFPPSIPSLGTAKVPLDTAVSKFTLQEDGLFEFIVWTTWPGSDTTTWNDTLRTEYTLTKDFLYPYAYNYPAGQGQLRYWDQGFYSYPLINIRTMDTSEVAAVHFSPDEQFYPFDCRLALVQMSGYGGSYNLNIYGPGVDDDHPGDLWNQVAFVDSGVADEVQTVRIELDDVAALQHLSSDFWLGVEFPLGTDTNYVMGCEASDPDLAKYEGWYHSYLYWDPPDTTGSNPLGWYPYRNIMYYTNDTQYDDPYDWAMTCVISIRTIFPEALRDAADSLYLDWDDVSQAKDYLIYRGTHVDSPFPFLDSTAVSEYYDPGAVGDVDTSYFYLFHTRHQDGGVYDKTSAAVGEFDKYLSPVK